jgi:site-specific DNA recombinase
MVDALSAGTLTPEDVGGRIPKLRSARDRAKAELAAIGEPAKVVTLHPAAINDYLRNLDRLAEIIGADLAEGDDGIAQALRALVETVTIMPAPAGEAPQVRVAGHLESLLKSDAFDRRSSAGGEVVAGERLEPPTGAFSFS